jgi:hypothetical protein
MAGTITGKHVLWDVSMVVNSVDLSDHAETVAFGEMNTNKQEAAAMGEIQDYSMPGTLMITDPVVTFYADFAAAKVYATLYAAWIARTVFNIVGKASSGANSTTNPAWTIPVFLGKAPMMTGTRGNRHMTPTTFAVAGALSVATS